LIDINYNVMPAPLGNLFALGNNGGRPPMFNHPEDLAFKIEEYFEYIQGELGQKESRKLEKQKDGSVKEVVEMVDYWVRRPERPTVTGISLFLGFADKSSFYEYKKNEEFSYLIKRAATKIEQYHEDRVADGDKCTGNIFVLKNMGWKDKSEIDIGGDVNIPIKEWAK